jgi:cytidylate kinase
MSAAGKTTVSKIIAKRLDVKAIGGGEILREIAKERGYNPEGEDWWDTDEGMKFLKEREGNLEFDKLADIKMRNKIKAGDIVVTSYTAPWIIDSGFKVWLSASAVTRAKRMAKRDKTDIEKSEDVVKIRDVENLKLYKELYNIDLNNDTTPFDMVVDTEGKTPDEIADIILSRFYSQGKNK